MAPPGRINLPAPQCRFQPLTERCRQRRLMQPQPHKPLYRRDPSRLLRRQRRPLPGRLLTQLLPCRSRGQERPLVMMSCQAADLPEKAIGQAQTPPHGQPVILQNTNETLAQTMILRRQPLPIRSEPQAIELCTVDLPADKAQMAPMQQNEPGCLRAGNAEGTICVSPVPRMDDARIRAAGLGKVLLLRPALYHAQPVIAQKQAALPFTHTDAGNIGHRSVRFFLLMVHDGPRQQLPEFRQPAFFVPCAGSSIDHDIPALAAGIGTGPAAADKILPVIRLQYLQPMLLFMQTSDFPSPYIFCSYRSQAAKT